MLFEILCTIAITVSAAIVVMLLACEICAAPRAIRWYSHPRGLWAFWSWVQPAPSTTRSGLGATARFTAWLALRRREHSGAWIFVWNTIGFLDFAAALALGATSTPGAFSYSPAHRTVR
jgi:hypothetical protein